MSGGLTGVGPRLERLAHSLERLDAWSRVKPPASLDNPIFLVSTAWRAGSTLFQRILMTDPGLLMWGEPLEALSLVNRMVEPLLAFTDDWPPTDFWLSHRAQPDFTRDWVANMAPDPSRLKAAYLSFFNEWLATPARARGYDRWGAKQVRWSGEEGLVMRWLYPRARFVLISRHPLSAYESLCEGGPAPAADNYWIRWPYDTARDAASYARYWNDLAFGWAKVKDELGAVMVRYEDLIAGRLDFTAIGQALELTLRPEAALGAKAGASRLKRPLEPAERDQILTLTAEGRAALGYADQA